MVQRWRVAARVVALVLLLKALRGGGVGPARPDDLVWLAPRLHKPLHDGARLLLAESREEVAAQARPPPELAKALAYLEKLVAQLPLLAFRAAG